MRQSKLLSMRCCLSVVRGVLLEDRQVVFKTFNYAVVGPELVLELVFS